MYDDIVLENPTLKGFPVFDLDRIEVLRGPQGTLFGRNTPAGVIKFESVRPSQDQDAYVRLGYGRYGSLNFEGAIGGAVLPRWVFCSAGSAPCAQSGAAKLPRWATNACLQERYQHCLAAPWSG